MWVIVLILAAIVFWCVIMPTLMPTLVSMSPIDWIIVGTIGVCLVIGWLWAKTKNFQVALETFGVGIGVIVVGFVLVALGFFAIQAIWGGLVLGVIFGANALMTGNWQPVCAVVVIIALIAIVIRALSK
jgi:hypothetical protein